MTPWSAADCPHLVVRGHTTHWYGCTRPGANCVTCCAYCRLARPHKATGRITSYDVPACDRRCEKVGVQ